MNFIDELKEYLNSTTKEQVLKDFKDSSIECDVLFNIMDLINKSESTPDIITRLQKLQRFDLDNYREGEYDIETEREEKEDGEYVDAYEIDRLIKDLTNGL